jgi:hypothetical protein
VECGDHYVRAMSSWALLEAAAGFHYSAPDKRLRFAPKLTPEDFRSFFITDSAWGTIAQKMEGRRQIETLSVAWGRVAVRALEFARVEPSRRLRDVGIKVAGRPVKAAWEESERGVEIKFGRVLQVTAPELVHVKLSSA